MSFDALLSQSDFGGVLAFCLEGDRFKRAVRQFLARMCRASSAQSALQACGFQCVCARDPVGVQHLVKK